MTVPAGSCGGGSPEACPSAGSTGPVEVSAAEVQRYVDAEEATLIDVRLEDDFKEAHIEGAQNFCVVESSSMAKLKERLGDAKDSLIIVYGDSARCHDSKHAQPKKRS